MGRLYLLEIPNRELPHNVPQGEELYRCVRVLNTTICIQPETVKHRLAIRGYDPNVVDNLPLGHVLVANF